MAELIGLIASILQLVDIVGKAHNYVKDFSEAPKHQQQLLQEIQNLEILVKELGKRFTLGAVTGRIQEANKLLTQLEKTMERLTKKLDSGGISKRVAWPLWGKDDIREGLETIERFKRSLSLWLEMDIQDLTRGLASSLEKNQKDAISAIQKGDEGHREAHQDIARTARKIARIQEHDRDAGMRDSIIEWYSPLNFFLRQDDILGTRQPGTCQWLLEDARFQAWESGTGKILWCQGMPGAGKTVFVSIVVDHLQALGPDVGVAVVYLNHKETDIQSPSMLLAALWRQLVFGKPISSNLTDLYRKHREKRTRPSLDEAHDVLVDTISVYSKVLILVDALDEYRERDRNTLLRCLSTLGPTVNLMLTSRPHIQINDIISDSDLKTLEMRAADEDIRLYLQAQISYSPRLSKHVKNRPGLREEIEAGVTQRSDGMFLLAKFHVDSLSEKHTVGAVREALVNLPGDLYKTYDDIGDRINHQCEDDSRLAWLTLSWIVNAKRPLRPSELSEALAVETETKALDIDKIVEMDIIRSVCTGLVIVNGEDDSALIRLVHYTAQGYLERIQTREFPDAATRIAKTCITYLSFDVCVDAASADYHRERRLFEKHAFLNYAVVYALEHARGRPETEIRPMILTFLTSNLAWRRLWRGLDFDNFLPDSASPLWTAASFHLKEFCRLMIQEEGTGTVLNEAVGYRRNDALQTLLEAGANVHATHQENGTVMHLALKLLHDDMVKMLVEHGADVNTESRGYPYIGTALHLAARNRNYEHAHFFLQHGAQVNLVNEEDKPAIYYALQSPRAHPLIARLLIEHGAVIDATQEGYERALRGASYFEDIATALLLIEHGVDVNAPSSYGPGEHSKDVGCTTLHKAVERITENWSGFSSNMGPI